MFQKLGNNVRILKFNGFYKQCIKRPFITILNKTPVPVPFNTNRCTHAHTNMLTHANTHMHTYINTHKYMGMRVLGLSDVSTLCNYIMYQFLIATQTSIVQNTKICQSDYFLFSFLKNIHLDVQ